MIDYAVNDLIDAVGRGVAEAAPRRRRRTCVRGRAAAAGVQRSRAQAEHLELKRYLREQLYKHYRVLRMTTKARRVVRELFDAMLADVDLMPTEHQEVARRLEAEDGRPGARVPSRTTSPA